MDRQSLIDSILELAAVEYGVSADAREPIADVRERLEDSLGRTVRPSEAARVLGVSQPALKRWLDNREIATVLTAEGRREIPVSELIDLRREVEQARDEGHTRALSAVIRRRKQEAREGIDPDRLLPPRRPRTHRSPELHSLAYHRLIGERLTPEMVKDTRRTLARWERSGRIDPRWAAEWRRLLELPLNQLAKAISSDNPRIRELRQSSPFAGALTEQERRRLLDAVEMRR